MMNVYFILIADIFQFPVQLHIAPRRWLRRFDDQAIDKIILLRFCDVARARHRRSRLFLFLNLWLLLLPLPNRSASCERDTNHHNG
ncbi:hypothetical protein D3C84_725150 [compost metagenome]